MFNRLVIGFATMDARLLLGGVATVAVSLFIISLALLRSANGAEPCWTVTDVAGRVTEFENMPKFDVNIRAIPFENDDVAGWIFPARVEQRLSCTE